MKKTRAACLLAILLLTSACQNSLYRDDQVYMVNRGETNKDELVSVITADGPQPFKDDALLGMTPAPNEVPIYIDENAQVMWLFRADSNPMGLESTGILAPPTAWGTLFIEDLQTGTRSVLDSYVPAPDQVRVNRTTGCLYWLAGGQLYTGDLRRKSLDGPADMASPTRLADLFISPSESSKLYMTPQGWGTFAYYPDTGRSVPLYEMQERIYDMAPLSKTYLYANQWRQEEKKLEKGLWTVIADNRRETVRALGRGSYLDAYGTGVLILGDQRFGLTLVTDFNAPEKALQITDQYIYQAGFFADGGIYWIGDNGIQQAAKPDNDAYLCHILAPDGHEQKRLTLSGAGLLVDPTGKRAQCAGPAAEQVDLTTGSLVTKKTWQSPWLYAPLGLESALTDTVRYFGDGLLGDPAALASLQDLAGTDLVKQTMADQCDTDKTLAANRHVEGSWTEGVISPASGLAEGNLQLVATDDAGHSEWRKIAIRYQLFAGQWRIIRFSVTD